MVRVNAQGTGKVFREAIPRHLYISFLASDKTTIKTRQPIDGMALGIIHLSKMACYLQEKDVEKYL